MNASLRWTPAPARTGTVERLIDPQQIALDGDERLPDDAQDDQCDDQADDRVADLQPERLQARRLMHS